jgi:hypothetical protein
MLHCDKCKSIFRNAKIFHCLRLIWHQLFQNAAWHRKRFRQVLKAEKSYFMTYAILSEYRTSLRDTGSSDFTNCHIAFARLSLVAVDSYSGAFIADR